MRSRQRIHVRGRNVQELSGPGPRGFPSELSESTLLTTATKYVNVHDRFLQEFHSHDANVTALPLVFSSHGPGPEVLLFGLHSRPLNLNSCCQSWPGESGDPRRLGRAAGPKRLGASNNIIRHIYAHDRCSVTQLLYCGSTEGTERYTTLRSLT